NGMATIKNDDFISLFDWDICDVEHTHIHANRTYGRNEVSVDEHVPYTIAEFSVVAIGVSDLYGCNFSVMHHYTPTVIPYGIAFAKFLYLRDAGYQAGHSLQG